MSEACTDMERLRPSDIMAALREAQGVPKNVFLGRFLGGLMKVTGNKHQDMAIRHGASPSELSRMLSGVPRWKPELLEAILDDLGVKKFVQEAGLLDDGGDTTAEV